MNARIIKKPDNKPEPGPDVVRTSEARSLPVRTRVNFWLDFLLLVNLLVMGWLSVIVRFIFPPGPASVGWSLWGLTFDQWSTIQFASLSVFYFGVLIHVMLHWSWVCGIVSVWGASGKREKIDDGLQTIYGVGFMIVLIAIVGLALAAALFSLQRPAI
jgi:hypothetical protein